MLFYKVIPYALCIPFCLLAQSLATVQQISSASIVGRGLIAINQPGQYLIAEDIDCAEKPIIISASNVELDLGGNTLTFSKHNPYGIFFTSGCNNISIKNGSIISNSPEPLSIHNNSGISFANLTISAVSHTSIAIIKSNNIRITNTHFTGSLTIGIRIATSVDVAIVDCSFKSVITKNFTGVHILGCETITCNNNIINNVQTAKHFHGFNVEISSRVVLTNNTISMNTARQCVGIGMSGGQKNTISLNKISMNSTKFLQHTAAKIGLKTNTKRAPTFIGIDIDKNEHLCIVSLNTINDNRGSYAAYGIRIQERATEHRHIHLEKNDISANYGTILQFGIYDEDNLSQNTYLRNRVSFHGQSLDGSSMPNPPVPKANYFLLKNCPIFNIIKEASADELSFINDDLQDKNLSIYGYLSNHDIEAGIFRD